MRRREEVDTPNRELLKGSTPTLILAILEEGPRHGYAIVREIERRTSATLSLGEGSLYPALHGMERDGFLSAEWVADGSGPARKVYALTDTGRAELAKRLRTWRDFVQSVESVIGDLNLRPEGGLPDAQPA